MPIIHLQVQAEGKDPNGNVVRISPALALAKRGPFIQVTVGLGKSYADPLIAKGITVPAPVTGVALIDTGASACCINEAIAQQMGLPVIDQCHIASASKNKDLRNVYPIQIELVNTGITFQANRAAGVELESQDFIALIGRDALHNAILIYNGMTGEITIAR